MLMSIFRILIKTKPTCTAMSAKTFWSSEKIVSLSAIIISLFSLVALVYQTNLMRLEQQLTREAELKSKMPYVMIANTNYGGPNYAITLLNKGLGPAIIDSFSIITADSVYQMDLATYLLEMIPETGEIDHLYYANLFPGQFISAGEELNLVGIDNSRESADELIRLMETTPDLDYRLIYRSVYNERWLLTGEQLTPVKLAD